jgi:YHS domain-containing protein
MTGRKLQIKSALCGKTIISKEKEEPKEKRIIVEIIDGTTYYFDNNDCVLMFKKFRGVYGGDFI